MLKLLVVSVGILATLSGFSNENQKILIREKAIDLQKIMGDEVTLVDKEIVLVRDDKSPKNVTINFDYHKLSKSCTEYEIKSKTQKEIEVNSCEQVSTGSSKQLFNCEVKTFDAFEILKRICSKKGLILKNETKKLKVLFLRSVALSPGATEEFSLKFKQNKMDSAKVEVTGKVENSSSLYKVNNLFNSVLEFKAK